MGFLVGCAVGFAAFVGLSVLVAILYAMDAGIRAKEELDG